MGQRNAEKENIYVQQTENDFDEVVRRKKKSKRKSRFAAVIIVALIVVLGVYVCNGSLLTVKKVELKSLGEEEISLPYTQQELLSGLGLEKGMGLYDIAESELENNARYNLTYIKEMEISRRWPSTVVVRATAENARFYISIDGKIYVLSDELRVLETTDDIEKIEAQKLIILKVSSVKKCVKGDIMDVGKDINEIVVDLSEQLEKEGSLSRITLMDVTDKFNIKLMFETRFEVKIGDSKDLGNKIKMMNEIVKDKQDEMASGVIDVTKDYGKTGSLRKFS